MNMRKFPVRSLAFLSLVSLSCNSEISEGSAGAAAETSGTGLIINNPAANAVAGQGTGGAGLDSSGNVSQGAAGSTSRDSLNETGSLGSLVTGTAGTAGQVGGGGGSGSGVTDMSSEQMAPMPDIEVQFDAQGCPLVPALRLERVVALTQTGMLLEQAAGDDRMFIAERPGRILILRNGELAPTPFLDFRASIAPLETERGLLSMALHPSFSQTGRFYVVYTRAVNDPVTPNLTSLGDLVIAEGSVSARDPNLASSELTVLFTIPKSVRYHNGGMLAFGPDGYLYVSTGEDGRIYGADADSLQQVDHKLGKILRVDVDAPNTSPPGNIPGADIHVWDYGLRNPWRMSFDRLTGDLYIGDVGEATFDEIIYEPMGQGGRNYGWGVLEANQCNAPFGGCSTDGMTPPILAIPHDGPGSVDNTCRNDFEQDAAQCNRAVVGGYVYRGSALPELNGRYFYGDNIQNTVQSFIVRNGEVTCQAEHTADLVNSQTRIQGMVSFSEDAAGELYILDLFGNVYRVAREI